MIVMQMQMTLVTRGNGYFHAENEYVNFRY